MIVKLLWLDNEDQSCDGMDVYGLVVMAKRVMISREQFANSLDGFNMLYFSYLEWSYFSMCASFAPYNKYIKFIIFSSFR
jgi:hypothetical protein